MDAVRLLADGARAGDPMPAVGQSGLLNSGPLWHAAKISVFTSVPQGRIRDEDEDATRLVEPKILCMAEIRDIRPGGPGPSKGNSRLVNRLDLPGATITD